MKKSSTVFKVGTRPSKLAVAQAIQALDRVKTIDPHFDYELIQISSAGDRDRAMDLRDSPADFFTLELDEALKRGDIDCAIHSAKDLPDPLAEQIDWFWIPWREEPRDCWIFRKDEPRPINPVIGVSSARRAEYADEQFPGAPHKTIRGNIDERIAQLDAGDFDAVLMAGAALCRLDMTDRISEWIPLDELPVPAGQGHLAITFLEGTEKMIRFRNLFNKAIVFAGAGAGDAKQLTQATREAMESAEVCLYDALLDTQLLDYLPANCERVPVGKRCGAHSKPQAEITQLVADYARQSKRVVRLKGGDPCTFGRLAEEIEFAEELGLAYRVLPGISAFQVGMAESGMLLTRRGISRGFTILTPRAAGGAIADISVEQRGELPIVFYMSVKASAVVVEQLIADGMSPSRPAAALFGAGMPGQFTVKAPLAELPAKIAETETDLPGLLWIGEISDFEFIQAGALAGKKVLLTCSETLQQKAAQTTFDAGGKPIHFPLIQLEARDIELDFNGQDWLVISSPASVRCLLDQVSDLRSLPKILACGKGTADEFAKNKIIVDAMPVESYSADSIFEQAKLEFKAGERILRLRSTKAGNSLSERLKTLGVEVIDQILYDNVAVKYETCPAFDIVFFASASAVESFIAQFGKTPLEQGTTLCIGLPTADALERHGLRTDCIAKKATVDGAFQSLRAIR